MITPDKQYLMERRLAPLLVEEGLSTLEDFADRLADGKRPDLEQALAEAMATHESLFFRDLGPFEHLRDVGLPNLLRARPAGSKLRMWSAAASTGQEAYSLAMCALEAGLTDSSQVEVLGTDFARQPISRARQGIFTQYEVQRGLSVRRLLTFFDRREDGWQVKPAIRSLCTFREWNLLDEPAPLGMFDVVFCRNVLYYFDATTKLRVLGAIARQLAPDGLLYLGATECAIGLDDVLERDSPNYALPLHVIAPLAATGHKHVTTPARTPTYQS